MSVVVDSHGDAEAILVVLVSEWEKPGSPYCLFWEHPFLSGGALTWPLPVKWKSR